MSGKVGKGTIAGGGSEGLYTINVDYGDAQRDARVNTLHARQESLDEDITAKQEEVTEAQDILSEAIFQVDNAITAYMATQKTDEDRHVVAIAVSNRNAAYNRVQAAKNQLALLNADLAGVEKALLLLGNLDVTQTKSAWCVDYTEDATGEVATIEINGEQPVLLIAPGGESPTAGDGYMLNRAIMTGPQAYLNAAMLPGWQKFMPTYRLGTISNINYEADTADVALDSAHSSAQNLNINKVSSLSGIPIEYMNCHAGAFADGDDVVVKFEGQSWDSPKVIGFKDHPKVCAPKDIWFLVEVERWETIPAPATDGGYAGLPYTPQTYSTGPTGHEITYGDTFGGDYSIGGVLSSWGQENDAGRAILRIRFDVAWSRNADEGESFYEPYFEADMESLDVNYTIPSNFAGALANGGGLLVSTQGLFYPNMNGALTENQKDMILDYPSAPVFTLNPWSTGMSLTDLPILQGYDIHGDPVYIMEPFPSTAVALFPTWIGTRAGRTTYVLAAWDGVSYTHSVAYHANDLDHASNWLLQVYDPPRRITLKIKGADVDYDFVRIGGSPKCVDTWHSVPPAVPPSAIGTTEYLTRGEGQIAVVYTRRDGD